LWKSWNWPSHSSECLLCWLRLHLVIERSSLTVKKASVRIAVQPILNVKARWHSTLGLHDRAYKFREFSLEWLKNSKYSYYRPLLTTQDEWTILKYIMEVLRPFGYWTLWMSKRHMVTLHHVITVYNNMFHHMDGLMRALAKKMNQWKEDLYFTMRFTQQKQSKYYTEVTATMGMLLVSADILDPFRKVWTFRKWDEGVHNTPENNTSYTTQYQRAFLMYVTNEYCANHWSVLVIEPDSVQSNNHFSSAMASRSGQSSHNQYDLSSDGDEDLMAESVAEMTPGQSDQAACLLTATRLNLNSPPESPQNWGQVNPNLDDYDSNSMESCKHFGFRISPTGGVSRRKCTQSTPNPLMWHATYSLLYHMAMEWGSSFTLGWDVIGSRKSKITLDTTRERVIIRQFSRANNGILAGDDEC